MKNKIRAFIKIVNEYMGLIILIVMLTSITVGIIRHFDLKTEIRAIEANTNETKIQNFELRMCQVKLDSLKKAQLRQNEITDSAFMMKKKIWKKIYPTTFK